MDITKLREQVAERNKRTNVSVENRRETVSGAESKNNEQNDAGFIVVDSAAVGERIVVVTDPSNDAYRRARAHAVSAAAASVGDVEGASADATRRDVAPLAVYLPYEIEDLRTSGVDGGKVGEDLLRAVTVTKRILDGTVIVTRSKEDRP